MTNDFKLPLVGLATSSYEFSKENPEAGIRQLRGGLKRLLATELAMARCEFGRLKGYYETLDMTAPLYLGRLAPQFFANLIRFRNHFTGEKVTTALTPREFYIALELCDGHSYKDLAEKLDLSASRIAKQVQTIFSKLGINRKD